MAYPPTPEQQACIDTFQWGVDMKIDAYAGAGKTSVLKMLAGSTRDRGLYLVFGRANAEEAKGEFPDTVDTSTTFAQAFRWAVRQWRSGALEYRLGLTQKPSEAAPYIGIEVRNRYRIDGPTPGDAGYLTGYRINYLAFDTVLNFCKSADTELTRRHVPTQTGMETPAHRESIQDIVMPYAERIWEDVTRPDGNLRVNPQHYMKRWALTRPMLGVDYILLDEAQDTSPVVLDVIQAQRDHAQVVVVGDRWQAIMGFTGAINGMEEFDVEDPLYSLRLSQSWRFGGAAVEEANKWLRLLGETEMLRGNPSLDTRVAPLAQPQAVLSRTNAEAVAQLMDYQKDAVQAAVVGDTDQVQKVAEAAKELQRGRKPWHPQFLAFESWTEVLDYCEHSPDGGDFATAVKLVEEYGADNVIRAIKHQVKPEYAQVILSTAHKSKGLEWDTVRVADDFYRPNDDDAGRPVMPTRADMMLAYVVVTRARKVLDPTGLEWVNEYIAHLNAGTRFGARPGEKAVGARSMHAHAATGGSQPPRELVDAMRREIHKNTTALLPDEARQGGRIR